MNKECQDVCIGTILGDGYLSPRGVLQVEHARKDHQYVIWKHQKMSEIVSGPISPVVRLNKKTGKNTFSSRFYTKSVFSEYRTLFYPSNKKIVPDTINQLLDSSLALATLFMDDGGKGGNTSKGMVFNFSGFDQSGQEKLRSCLLRNFNLHITFHQTGKYQQLYIPTSENQKFLDIVSPFVIPSMKYRLAITP